MTTEIEPRRCGHLFVVANICADCRRWLTAVRRPDPTESTSRVHWHEDDKSPDVVTTWRSGRGGSWERRYVALDALLYALENSYHPQNPTALHPADFVRARFGDHAR